MIESLKKGLTTLKPANQCPLPPRIGCLTLRVRHRFAGFGCAGL